jgi:tRNA/rRNA methyltransferase
MLDTALARVRIVLVEPAGALNVGAIARVMKNMGLHQLVLVNPHCDPLGTEARQMAVHAVDLLEAAQQVATLPAALQGCQRAIATTTRDRSLVTKLEHPRTGLPWLLEPPIGSGSSPQAPNATPLPTQLLQSALVFGPEDRGLSNTELNYAQRFVRIPSNPAYPSLNLAQAVAICCYELYQTTQQLEAGEVAEAEGLELKLQTSFQEAPSSTNFKPQTSNLKTPESNHHAAPLEVLEGYFQQLEALLLKIGYLYPHTAASRMEKFRRLFNRASLSAAEVAMLRGILSQMEWMLQTAPGDPAASSTGIEAASTAENTGQQEQIAKGQS